jgi:hypothetical protein
MKWLEAEEDRAKDCECAFQNGGPRVYVYEEEWSPSAPQQFQRCCDHPSGLQR